MRSNAFGLFVLGLIVAAGVFQIAYYYPKLPATVASHFDIHGRANDWMPKESFVALNAIVLASLLVIVLIMGLVTPRVPAALINLPHKDYWLDPQRRRQTDAVVFGLLLWCFNATGLLLLAVFELAYLANLGYPDTMRWMVWALLAAYLGFVAVLIITLYRRFAEVPDEAIPP